MQRLKVAVLGAGGLVAQRLQQRLSSHPWFSLEAVAGSPRFEGMAFADVPWTLDEDRPAFPSMQVLDVLSHETPKRLRSSGVRVAFSALPSEQAIDIEPRWAEAGIVVFSNASAYRGATGIPLVVPEINGKELANTGGGPLLHACATNCTLLPLALPLAALNEAFGLIAFTMRSEQGLSGGGHAYMQEAIADGRVDPEIPGEAEKTGQEFDTVLDWTGSRIINCARVMRKDGHQVFVTATFERPFDPEEARHALQRWSDNNRFNNLPSSPHQPLMLVDCVDAGVHLFADGKGYPGNPNPAVDLDAGMAIVVGNLESPEPMVLQFQALSHNTIRGAAGGLIFLAELALHMNLIEPN